MVKNSNGGKGAKSMARKLVNNYSSNSNTLRLPDNNLEQFAIVTKMYGNMCQVYTNDNRDLKCHIRGKFKGRSKRNSFISMGSIILVGFRHFEAPNFSVCDLLEVYSAHEISSITSLPSFNISSLLSNTLDPNNINNTSDDFIFANSTSTNTSIDDVVANTSSSSDNIIIPSSSSSSSIDDLIMDI
jgi:translation initiation factor IF-1